MKKKATDLPKGAPKAKRGNAEVKAAPADMAGLIDGLSAGEAPVRFGSLKALKVISEQQPARLYPQFDFLAGLLDHPNRIFQWTGAMIIANLAKVDSENRLEAMLDKYFAPIAGPVMITAGTVIKGGALIARAKPALADRIAVEILKVVRAEYATPECRNVAIGHALAALGGFLDLLSEPKPVLNFARAQLHNPRPSTRKKAEALLHRAERASA